MAEVKVTQAPELKRDAPPIHKDLEAMFERVRQRAFELCSGRGFGEGHDLDDWLAAEREVCWPACELAEQGDDYRLSVALPGFESAEVSVTATQRDLIVHAATEKSTQEPAKKPDCVRWSEFQGNDVYRKVTLDRPIDPKSVTATMKNGMLTVVARKADIAKRAVTIAAAA